MMLRGVLSFYFAQLADPPIARLDLGERVVIGAENVEQIVADGQLPNVGRAGEVHDERHSVGLGAPGVDKALRRLASAALVDEGELVAELAEQPVAAVRAAGAHAGHLLGAGGRESGRREHEAVADRVAAHHDRRIAGAAADVRKRRRWHDTQAGHDKADRCDPDQQSRGARVRRQRAA
jgi:hypothetical protein